MKETLLLAKIAGKGDPDAQNYMGEYMSELDKKNKKQAETDQKIAVELFSLAAAKGHAQAQYNLGRCLILGKGVAKNEEEGIRQITNAANQQNEQAVRYMNKLQEKKTSRQRTPAKTSTSFTPGHPPQAGQLEAQNSQGQSSPRTLAAETMAALVVKQAARNTIALQSAPNAHVPPNQNEGREGSGGLLHSQYPGNNALIPAQAVQQASTLQALPRETIQQQALRIEAERLKFIQEAEQKQREAREANAAALRQKAEMEALVRQPQLAAPFTPQQAAQPQLQDDPLQRQLYLNAAEAILKAELKANQEMLQLNAQDIERLRKLIPSTSLPIPQQAPQPHLYHQPQMRQGGNVQAAGQAATHGGAPIAIQANGAVAEIVIKSAPEQPSRGQKRGRDSLPPHLGNMAPYGAAPAKRINTNPVLQQHQHGAQGLPLMQPHSHIQQALAHKTNPANVHGWRIG
jgi:hypothetical protein